jgi:hypothetical protein
MAMKELPMRARLTALVVLAASAAAGGFAALVATAPARAGEESPCTAYVVGASSAKGAVPELVLFNTTSQTMTLDLDLLGPDGVAIISRAGEVVVNGRQTLSMDLLEQFKRDLTGKAKPYAGTFTVALHGPVGFTADRVIVHVTQYYGTRTKPKAAYVLDPVFQPDAL